MQRSHHLSVPLISAHRGACGVEGLPAAERYRRAIELGVDFVEFDVRRTADNVHVIHHDHHTASGRIIRDFAHRDLIGELGPEALTFDELLEIAAGRVGLHLDLKESGYEAEIVHLALARCRPDRLVITGADASIRTIKLQFPDLRAGLTLGDDVTHLAPWLKVRERLSELFPGRRLARCRADFVAVHHQLAGLTVLRFCARKHMPAWVWTVDEEPAIARFMADARVTTLITNRPDIALRLRRS
jgi:glycerophosphoryl diester phosphodiesterase